MNIKNFLFLSSSLFLVACSNPKEVSKSNFKDAIQEYLTQNKPCISYSKFPFQISESEFYYKDRLRILDELVSIGFLTSEKTEKEKMFSRKHEKEPAMTYSLTNAGKAVLTKDDDGSSFCYGEYNVVEIRNFSEPVVFMGKKMSEVRYSYKMENIPDWFKNSKFMKEKNWNGDWNKRISENIASIEKPIKTKTILVLTNDGWMEERLFRKLN